MKPEIMLLWAENAKVRTSTGTAGNGARNTGMSPTQVVKGAINTGVQFSNQGVKVTRDTFFLQSTSTRSSL